MGKNNGSFQGKVYFKCEEDKGIFINPASVVSVS
jgi:dynactin complex subunit